MILSPSIGQAQILLKVCEDFSTNWKIDFNASKSVALTMQKNKIKDLPCFKLNNLVIPDAQNIEYLGLPIGDSKYVSEYLEEKWKKVEKSFYSFYGLDFKPKMSSPDLVAFLYKQFCQSIFRYHLDIVIIGEKKLGEFDIRQNFLLKKSFWDK